MASFSKLALSPTALLMLNPTWDRFKAIVLITAFCNSLLLLPKSLNPMAVY